MVEGGGQDAYLSEILCCMVDFFFKGGKALHPISVLQWAACDFRLENGVSGATTAMVIERAERQRYAQSKPSVSSNEISGY